MNRKYETSAISYCKRLALEISPSSVFISQVVQESRNHLVKFELSIMHPSKDPSQEATISISVFATLVPDSVCAITV